MIIYLSSGLSGALLSGTFYPQHAILGASAAIYGVAAWPAVELFAHWRLRAHPKSRLRKVLIDLALK